MSHWSSLIPIPTPHLIAGILFVLLLWRLFTKDPPEKPVIRSVAILVLGDVGRSPRMMYHAHSFAQNGFYVFLIGYEGSSLTKSLRTQPNFRAVYLSEPLSIVAKLPFVFSAPIKVIHQICTVLVALMIRVGRPPQFILVQNPPSIPSLALVWLVSRLRGSKVIIDWHNLGYSILALKLGDEHLLVRIYKKFEAYFGRIAYGHLFVTEAMQNRLVQDWDLQGDKVVLHDRPMAHFHRCNNEEIHSLFVRLQPSLALPALQNFLPEYSMPYSTPFTSVSKAAPSHGVTTGTGPSPFTVRPHSPTGSPPQSQEVAPIVDPSRGAQDLPVLTMPGGRPDRPALVVSSTSWTPDEDFSILIDALAQYETWAKVVNAQQQIPKKQAEYNGSASLPKLLMIVTGKGPLKTEYMRKIAALQKGWHWVRCISLWLEAEDYPLLLGSADVGVSLHKSSSNLDLPMKVVDMFGCALPVCALDFECLHELVRDGTNGLVFSTSDQLAEHLEKLLKGFPETPKLDQMRENLMRRPSRELEGAEWCSWEENWNMIVRPLVLADVDGEDLDWIRGDRR